jgi:tol-pal system protein YbgF
MRNLALALIAALLIAPTARAQDSALMDRLLRLERDVNFLQKQVYSGTGNAADPNVMPMATGEGAAQLQVRLSAMEEELRTMRGQVETAQFQAGEAKRDLQKMKEDYDYRLQALEQAQSAASMAPVAGEAAAAEPAASASATPAAYTPKAATGADFPDANAAYNAAFKKLNAKDYSGAATDFDAFVKKYPNDPLASNAYYWLGESYYARGDYTRAADGFRKGFETNPQGQKAADNLLKLALSLDRVKRTSEACIVLGQVVSKYGDSSPTTKTRAESERSRMQCK